MGLQTNNGKISTISHAISKQIKLELPDWRQIKDLFKSFKRFKISISLFLNSVKQFAI